MGSAVLSHQLLANAGSPPVSFASGDVSPVLSGWFAIWFAKSAHQLMSAYSAKADQLDKRH